MKFLLRSIKPYWLYLILTGKKTLELGKTIPQADDWDKIVYLYCSKDIKSFNRIPEADREWMRKYLGKVACCFVCDYTEEYRAEFCDLEYKNCMSKKCAKNDIHKIIGYNDEEAPIYVFETSNEREDPNDCELIKNSRVSFDEIRQYIGETFYDKSFYGWHISDLVIYESPKELSDFVLASVQHTNCFGKRTQRLTRPPQSWCYVEKAG